MVKTKVNKSQFTINEKKRKQNKTID